MKATPDLPRLSIRPVKRLKISMTPLIDVVFILLVFFMLASSFHDWRSIQLSSAGKPGQSTGLEGAMLIDLTLSGPRLSGELLGIADLQRRLTDRLSQKPDQRVMVRPLDGINMQQVVTLLDSIAATGVQDISLMPGR